MTKLNKLIQEKYKYENKVVSAMVLANTINVSKRTIYRKLKDNSFTIKEAIRIQELLFPNFKIKDLFR